MCTRLWLEMLQIFFIKGLSNQKEGTVNVVKLTLLTLYQIGGERHVPPIWDRVKKEMYKT